MRRMIASMNRSSCSVSVVFFLLLSCTRALLVLEVDNNSPFHYTISDSVKVLFESSAIAFYHDNNDWCVAGETLLADKPAVQVHGEEPGLGHFEGLQIEWMCHGDTPIVTTFKTFSNAIVFETVWPKGATYATPPDDPTTSLTNFPSLLPHLPQRVSWHGSFVQGIHDYSEGSTGGPVVFYDPKDMDHVIVASPFLGSSFKSFTAGNNKSYQGDKATPVYSPGTSGRIRSLPVNYKQSILLYQSLPDTGMVGGLLEWGTVMQRAVGLLGRLPDVTLEKVGYQTDNGAYYCFCTKDDCSQLLLDEMDSLRDVGIGYLSFQGAGASRGRGQAAPWCVELWGVDGGLADKFPTNLKDFSKVLALPLQYYVPYFCPNTLYFDDKWNSVPSNTSLPGCHDYDFLNVEPSQSKSFYGEFFDRGVAAGMYSFETDFMNQNYNCVPDFVKTTDKADRWQQGMTSAAFERGIPIQWCYAAPTDVLASLQQPAVTNFRVSFDFCYGNSWNTGLSSLLVSALGAAPSKDTLWTTTNGKFKTPGCGWTPDHEEPAIELHAILALMSTGPVGISDAIGQTDKTLVKRMVAQNGDLLKPSRAIAVTDSTFTDSGLRLEDAGYVYGTSALGPSWIFVSFKLKESFQLTVQDFWPRLFSMVDDDGSKLIYHRFFSPQPWTRDAIIATTISYHSSALITLPPSSFVNVTGGSDFAPVVTQVWTPCARGGWTLLGESNKYVPLSPARFTEISCLPNGLSGTIVGSSGETVELAALDSTGTWVTKTVSFSKSGTVQFRFGSQDVATA